MTSSEPERWSSGIDGVEVVLVVGNSQVASIFGAIVVGVAHQRSFVVIMEVGVGDSYVVDSMGDIKQAIIVILAVIHVRGKITVINPDALSILNPNSISSICQDLLDLEVTDDDVGFVKDTKTDADKSCDSGQKIQT